MDVNRRHLIGASAAGVAGALAMSPDAARAAPLTSALGRDATQYGVRPGSPDDQTRALQRAIDEAARAQVPLALPPGVYRTGMLRLQNGTQLIGVRGATKLVFNGGASMLQGEGAGQHRPVPASRFDGGGIPLPTRRGLVHCLGGRDIRITDCEITGSGGNGIWLEQVSGDISGNIFTKIATTAVVSFDAQGLIVSRNTIIGTNDNGIEILRTAIGDDGTLVADNRIEDIKAGPGGSGQYGNAINAFRAGNVIVRGNRIRNCDYSAVRGNSASNIQITGNSVSDVREVALYSEFSFEAAVIANNTVDGAARRRLRLQFQRRRPHRGRAGQHHPQPAAEAADRHRAGRRRRHRHLCRGGHLRDRQCDRERAVVRDRRRLGQISARRRHHGQRDPQGLCRHRRLGGAGRGHRAGQQQHDLGNAARRRGRPRSRPRRHDRICPPTARSVTRRWWSGPMRCGEDMRSSSALRSSG